MAIPIKRLVLWGTVLAAIAAGFVYAFWPRPVLVDLAAATRGPLTVTIDEEGETRVRDVFVVSAPVTGRLLRVDSEVGDAVVADETVLARIEPADPTFLDVRTAAEAEAAVRTAEAARTLAAADLRRTEAELAFARAELERAQKLAEREWISQSALDAAQRTHETRRAEVETARAVLEMRAHELEQARTRLLLPGEAKSELGPCACIDIRAPIDGRVLRLFRESEGVVQAAEPLVEIGDPRNLEIVVDLLSADAVRVEAGQRVIVDDWGGEAPIGGRVRRVEPFGFTKVSALGIEEQRVNVIVDLVDPAETWVRLGHGYRVEARIVLWHGDDVLKVPQGALFRDGDRWAVYAVANGRAALTPVTLGRRNGLEAEILDGLAEGEAIILHPGDRVTPGVRIAPRD